MGNKRVYYLDEDGSVWESMTWREQWWIWCAVVGGCVIWLTIITVLIIYLIG
jgi:hypothetical protein